MNKRPLVGSIQFRAARQRGAVLIVALMMLLVMTTLGVSTITSTNISLQLVQSQQRQQEASQAAQNSINYLLSDIDYYVNGDFTLSFPTNVSNGMTVTVNGLQCLLQATPAGCSLLEGSSAPCHPEYYWEADVSVTDTVSGASSNIVEGFKFRYLEGYCPV